MNISTDGDWIASTARSRNLHYDLSKPFSYTLNDTTYSGTTTEGIGVDTYDNVTSKFLTRMGDGEVVMNDFKRVDDETVDNLMLREWVIRDTLSGVVVGTCTGTCSSSSYLGMPDIYNLPDTLNIQSICNRALDKVYARANDSEALALATLAEARKTYNMFANTMRGVIHMAKHSKRLFRRRRNGSISNKQFTEKWLEYRYGWRPLVFEAKNLIDAASKAGSQRRVRFVVSEYEKNDEVTEDNTFVDQRQKVHNYDKGFDEARVVAGLLVSWDSPFKDFSDTAGMNRILETAWELVPYSFVVDWFLNVGDYIAARSNRSFEVEGSWVTVHRRQERIREYTNWSPNVTFPYYTDYAYYTGAKCGRILKTRTRYANPPLGLLPQIDVNLNVSKLTDLLALARQFLPE